MKSFYQGFIRVVLFNSMSAIALALLPLSAIAQSKAAPFNDYPNKPIKLIVAAAAGGNADFVSRLIGSKVGEALGQPFVIDNRAGASGMIAAEATVKASPDGYTLLLVGSSFQSNPGLYPDMPYDPLNDLAPITMPSNAPTVLVITPSVPATNVRELVEVARANPGKLNYAAAAQGGGPHLAGELLKVMAKVEISHVAYKGAAQVMTDLIAGRTQLSFASLPSVISHVRSGKLRAIAVTSTKRSAAMPDLPTMIESGYPGFELGAWQGMFSTAGTPRPIIDKLHREIIKAIHTPEVLKSFAAEGAEPVGNTPDEFAKWLRAEIPRWTKFINTLGIKV